ncbi:MAG: alpha-E domain-containing protein, partial [Alphaproteobacteria bacterium]|nr:alpha-E domain-containing protein [Alphaproteobacteria bacterium]
MLLSRVAEDLLWIGRYVERAENVARIADVSFRMGLLPAGGADAGAIWRPAIEITGDPEDYARRHAGYDEASALRYLVLDPDNSSSIVAALGRARDNARATRGTIAVEAWESLNATWLSLRDL